MKLSLIAAALQAEMTRERMRNLVTRGEVAGGIDAEGRMYVEADSLREFIAGRRENATSAA